MNQPVGFPKWEAILESNQMLDDLGVPHFRNPPYMFHVFLCTSGTQEGAHFPIPSVSTVLIVPGKGHVGPIHDVEIVDAYASVYTSSINGPRSYRHAKLITCFNSLPWRFRPRTCVISNIPGILGRTCACGSSHLVSGL